MNTGLNTGGVNSGFQGALFSNGFPNFGNSFNNGNGVSSSFPVGPNFGQKAADVFNQGTIWGNNGRRPNNNGNFGNRPNFNRPSGNRPSGNVLNAGLNSGVLNSGGNSG